MRRSVIGFCALLSFAGCASKTPGRAIGGTMMGLGGFSLITSYTRTEEPRSISDGIQNKLDVMGGWIMLAGGAVVLLFNEVRSTKDVETPPPSTEHIAGAETVTAPVTEDPQLRQLTLQASFAARRGQCNAVRVIADKVDELDAAYRRGGFVADSSIVACL